MAKSGTFPGRSLQDMSSHTLYNFTSCQRCEVWVHSKEFIMTRPECPEFHLSKSWKMTLILVRWIQCAWPIFLLSMVGMNVVSNMAWRWMSWLFLANKMLAAQHGIARGSTLKRWGSELGRFPAFEHSCKLSWEAPPQTIGIRPLGGCRGRQKWRKLNWKWTDKSTWEFRITLPRSSTHRKFLFSLLTKLVQSGYPDRIYKASLPKRHACTSALYSWQCFPTEIECPFSPKPN